MYSSHQVLQYEIRFFDDFLNFQFYNYYSKKKLNFKKIKIPNFENQKDSFVEKVFMRLWLYLFAICLATRFLKNFKTFSTYDRKPVKKWRKGNRYNSKNIRPVNFKVSQKVTNWCLRRCAKIGGGAPRGRGTSCPNPLVISWSTLIRTKKVKKKQSCTKWSKIKKLKKWRLGIGIGTGAASELIRFKKQVQKNTLMYKDNMYLHCI